MSCRLGELQSGGSIEWWACEMLAIPLRDDFYWIQYGPNMEEDEQDIYSLHLFPVVVEIRKPS